MDAKKSQGHDNDPPRCATCVFYRHEPHTLFREVTKGKKTIRVPVRRHPINNPMVERCSFGNFEVRKHHLCDEWRNRKGEVLE